MCSNLYSEVLVIPSIYATLSMPLIDITLITQYNTDITFSITVIPQYNTNHLQYNTEHLQYNTLSAWHWLLSLTLTTQHNTSVKYIYSNRIRSKPNHFKSVEDRLLPPTNLTDTLKCTLNKFCKKNLQPRYTNNMTKNVYQTPGIYCQENVIIHTSTVQ